MGLSLDEFKNRIAETEVRCEICAYRSHSLARHLVEKHHQSVGQYHKTFPKAEITSPIVNAMLGRVNRIAVIGSADLDKFLPDSKAFSDELQLFAMIELLGRKLGVDPTQTIGVPEVDENYKFNDPALLGNTRLVLYGMAHGKNIYLSGPTGCGKSEHILQIHARMKRQLCRVNMHGDVTAASFIGQMEANAQGTFFKKGVLPLAMEGGYTLLCDELDFTPPHIGAVLYPALEGSKTLYIPETGESIKAKQGFMVVGTANTGGKGDTRGAYTGTEVLNTAFLDRFPIKLNYDYLGAKFEELMLRKRFGGMQQSEITVLLKTANEIRTAFKQGSIGITVSTRKTIEYCQAFLELGKKEALDVTLINWLDEDESTMVTEICKRTGILK